ncbi:hypothetical protein RFI_20636 [Reticulomyxa filosa]|uniref:Uncharacterized protein n=1 Tax=Reticulomyxa filosa TaxID=46433 RepID=X6MTB6_RETFI|nr:hypothetical protein RFI_20636 [Reticulomyxa filosa]|eukprot:ETO16702.1 hypothetical protein RFI_20636 [Reticulomyxa filosa]
MELDMKVRLNKNILVFLLSEEDNLIRTVNDGRLYRTNVDKLAHKIREQQREELKQNNYYSSYCNPLTTSDNALPEAATVPFDIFVADGTTTNLATEFTVTEPSNENLILQSEESIIPRTDTANNNNFGAPSEEKEFTGLKEDFDEKQESTANNGSQQQLLTSWKQKILAHLPAPSGVNVHSLVDAITSATLNPLSSDHKPLAASGTPTGISNYDDSSQHIHTTAPELIEQQCSLQTNDSKSLTLSKPNLLLLKSDNE